MIFFVWRSRNTIDMRFLSLSNSFVARISYFVETAGLCGGPTVEAPCAATVYDVWAGKDLGTFSGSYTAKGIAPHDTAFLRLRAA